MRSQRHCTIKPVLFTQGCKSTFLQVDDDDLLKCDEFEDVSGKWFMDPSIDKTIIASKVNEEVESKVESAPKY